MTKRPDNHKGTLKLPEATQEILGSLRALFNVSDVEVPPVIELDRATFVQTFEPDTVVYRMVLQNASGKQALAKLYAQHAFSGEDLKRRREMANPTVDPIFVGEGRGRVSVHRVFIESGSTLLYVANELRRQDTWTRHRSLYEAGKTLPEGGAVFATLTNNNLAAHLLLSANHDRAHRIVPFLFPGFLEPKYEGIFNFYPNSGRPLLQVPRELADLKLEQERMGYAHSRQLLSQSQLLLLATSRLSLVYGPIVGSRENAMFKNACYNACVPSLEPQLTASGAHPREIHLFITIDKLVSDVTDIEFTLADTDRTPDEKIATIEEELENIRKEECFAVFDIQVDKDETLQSPFGRLIREGKSVPLSDGTIAPWMGEGYFRVCETWPDLFSKAGLQVQVFVSSEKDWQLDYLHVQVQHAQDTLQPRVTFHLDPKIAEANGFTLSRITISGSKS